jgi:hypothetical protein
MSERRKLIFTNLDEALLEAKQLLKEGYAMTGKWSLGQICFHMRTTIEANMNGYPKWMTALGYPLRPFLRWLALPRLLSGKSPKGIKTAGMFVPPGHLDDAKEVELLNECVSKFLACSEPMHAHPGFGRMSKEEFVEFHAAHAAHHLSFLSPAKK